MNVSNVDTRLPAIVESIHIDAPIATVYAALTTPEQVLRWWGTADTCHVTAMEADLRPGGAWKSTGADSQGNAFSMSGTYRVVDPPHAIEFTWNSSWSEDGHAPTETVVRYDLREQDGGTTLSVTHGGFVAASERDDHERGWKTVLGWVRAFLFAPAGGH